MMIFSRVSIFRWAAFVTIIIFLSSCFPTKAVVTREPAHFCSFGTPSSSEPDSDMGQRYTNRSCPENSFCSMDLRNKTVCLKALEDESIIPPTTCVCKTGESCDPNLLKYNSFASRKLSNCEKTVLQRRISMWIEVALENSTGQWGAPCNPRAEDILTNYILKRDEFSSGNLYEIESQLRNVLAAAPAGSGQLGFCDRAKLFRCVSCESGEKHMCFCADGTDVRRYLLERRTIRSEFCYAVRGDRTQDLTKIMPLFDKQKEKVARHYDVNNVCLLHRKVNTSANSVKAMGICTEDRTWLASKSYSDPCDIGETMEEQLGGDDVDYNNVNRSSKNETVAVALYFVHFVLLLRVFLSV